MLDSSPRARATQEVDPTPRIARVAGLGVLFFALLQWLPSALTAHGRAVVNPVYGFAVSVGVAVVVFGLSAAKGLPTSHADVALYLFVGWVIAQTALRLTVGETLRSLAFCTLLLSANQAGRYLAVDRRYERFWAALAPWFLVAYGLGLVVGVLRPESLWWGHGVFGSHQPRSWWWWFVVPQPMFAVAAFVWRRRLVPTRRTLYLAATVAVVVMLLATRTRIYAISVLGLLLLIYMTRYTGRWLAVPLAGLAVVLAFPGLVAGFGSLTRLSSFVTNVDPVSGSSDISNGRDQLVGTLMSLVDQNPLAGVGAAPVRAATATLAASSESGLLFAVASYGVLTVLLGIYLLAALFRSVAGLMRRDEDRLLYCMVVLVVLLAAFVFFGTATSFSDWLALVTVATVIHLPTREREDRPRRHRREVAYEREVLT